MKKTHLILFVIFSFSLLFSLPDRVNAEFRAGNGNGNIKIVCGSSGCGSDSNALQLVGYSGDLSISVYSRPFNFIRSDNGAGLNYGSNIPVGTKLNFSPYGDAWGNWWVSGGGYDTPAMGTGEHVIKEAQTQKNNTGRIDVKAPITSNPISIVGRGAVSCNGWTCTANSTGAAWIDVIFPGNSVEATSAPKYPNQDDRCKQTKQQCNNVSTVKTSTTYKATCDQYYCTCPNGGKLSSFPVGKWSTGQASNVYTCKLTQQGQQQVCKDVQVSGKDDCGQDKENISYSKQNITINFNVIPKPNQGPTVKYNQTTNISYTTAKANWTYTDPEGDSLKKSWVQIATDQAFTNIVFNKSQSGASTNMDLSGLRPGTTYYPRVIVHDSKGASSAWSNGPAFTTLINPTPNLAEFSCGVSHNLDIIAQHTTAKINWSYTGADTDPLYLKVITTKVGANLNPDINIIKNASKFGDISKVGLEAGSTYNIQIAVTDIYNQNKTKQIKDCGNISLEPYPDPTVEFSLSNNNNTKIAQKGETLIIIPNDGVKSLWNITDTFKLVDNGCSITTIDDGNNPSRADRIFDKSGLGFNKSLSGENIPQNISKDLKYRINLKCNGKSGYKGIDENIGLIFSPISPTTCTSGNCSGNTPTTTTCTSGNCSGNTPTTPTVSCSVNKSSVSSNAPDVEITANVGNASTYTWKAGPNKNDKTKNPISGNTTITNPLKVQYTGLGFGKYTPWLDIVANGNTISADCGIITNFGSSTIKEVNP